MTIVFIRYVLMIAILINVWLGQQWALATAITSYAIFTEFVGITMVKFQADMSALAKQAERILEIMEEHQREVR